MTKFLNLFSFKSSTSATIVMVVCALVISFIDSQLPQGVSIGEAYAILALIGLMAKDSRLITIGATVGTVLTLEGLYISEEGVMDQSVVGHFYYLGGCRICACPGTIF